MSKDELSAVIVLAGLAVLAAMGLQPAWRRARVARRKRRARELRARARALERELATANATGFPPGTFPQAGQGEA